MARKPKREMPLLRIFTNAQGEVFLKFASKELGSFQVRVERPVDTIKLDKARQQLFDSTIKELTGQRQAEIDAMPAERKSANEEIEATLDPVRKGRWLSKMGYAFNWLKIRGLTILFSLMLISLAYKGVQYSSERFPEILHFVVLCIYVLGLACLVVVIGTEENRLKYHSAVRRWFGPRGMLVLPLLLLITAASVLASFTFKMFSKGYLMLEKCSGFEVNEGKLLDFYVWHFVNIIPTLQLNKLIRWNEPYCYSQGRVGFLILVFQLLVVIPSFNTIRFYWTHRKSPSDYVFDPDWNPDPE